MRPRLLVIASVALPIALWALSPLVSQGAGPVSRAATLQSKIDAKRSKIARKRGTERVLSSDIARWTQRISRLQGRITSLRGREARIQADLDAKRAELIRIQDALRAERARLARLQARLGVVRRELADRLVQIYKSDDPDLVTVVLDARGFADLLERADFLRRVNDQDTRVLRIVRDAKADATSTATRLDELEARQQRVTVAILSRRDAIARVRQDLVDTRVGYDRTRDGKARALASTRQTRQNLEEDVRALQAEQARVQSALQTAQQQNSGAFTPGVAGPIRQGSGQLIWPVNGPVTSPFCERRAWESCHPGVDIGVASGTPIRAADSGKVVLMGPVGGYGNYTCVQHTATLSTCYAHQSSFATSVGASVSKGQVIGYSGCTGRCFGPHLHFEVRINGSVVNPMAYL